MNEDEINNPDIDEGDLDNIDAIASLLNGEPLLPKEEEPEEPEEEEQEEEEVTELPLDMRVKVKVDGVEQEVTLEELRNGYQRQADYTRKAQELASQRNELTQEQQELQSTRAQYEQYIQSVPVLAAMTDDSTNKALARLHSEEMIKLAKEDPGEYVAQKAELEKLIASNHESRTRMLAQYNEFQNQRQSEHQALLQDTIKKADEILAKELDGWADGTTKKAIAQYALGPAGLTTDEVNNLYDHRYVLILDKARRFDELMASQPAMKKRLEKAPPRTLSPGNDDHSQGEDVASKRKSAIRKANSGDESELINILSGML